MKKKTNQKSRTASALANDTEKQERSSKDRAPWLAKFRFRPGETGNAGGRKKGSQSVTAALKRMIAEGSTADQVAAAIIDGVITKRDPQFAKILLDRVDGTLAERLQAHVSGSFVGPVAGPVSVSILLPSNGRETVYPSPSEIAGASAAKPALPSAQPKKLIEVAAEQEEPAKLQTLPTPAKIQIEPVPKVHKSNMDALKPSGSSWGSLGRG